MWNLLVWCCWLRIISKGYVVILFTHICSYTKPKKKKLSHPVCIITCKLELLFSDKLCEIIDINNGWLWRAAIMWLFGTLNIDSTKFCLWFMGYVGELMMANRVSWVHGACPFLSIHKWIRIIYIWFQSWKINLFHICFRVISSKYNVCVSFVCLILKRLFNLVWIPLILIIFPPVFAIKWLKPATQ